MAQFTALDVISNALLKIGVTSPGDPIDAATSTLALTVFNDMLDLWSNESLACPTTIEQSLVLQVNKNQYLLGAGGDLTVRPLRIIAGPGAAYAQDVNGNNYEVDVVERDVWNQIGNRSLTTTSNVPSMIFYDPQFPLGILNTYPTPNVGNYTLFWDSYLKFATFAGLTSTVQMPEGYKKVFQDNLAVELIPYFQDASTVNPILLKIAAEGKATIKRTNTKTVTVKYDRELVSRSKGTYNVFTDGR